MNDSSGSVPHAPKHFYVDHAAYFITAATFQRQPILTDSVKACLRDALHNVFGTYQWSVEHWVILDDHYHLMARSHRGQDLNLIMRKVHHRVAREVNVAHPPARRGSRQVWHNYWDYCPR
ncbi:MAG: transposase, partial [Gammaproteobacteria bacterium]